MQSYSRRKYVFHDHQSYGCLASLRINKIQKHSTIFDLLSVNFYLICIHPIVLYEECFGVLLKIVVVARKDLLQKFGLFGAYLNHNITNFALIHNFDCFLIIH